MRVLGAAALFLLGAVVGSFLNVCIHRLPRGESIVRPRSRCPRCGAPIRPADNVPVLSWLRLRGRCRACGWRIPARYPLVEAATAALFAGGYLRFGGDPAFAVFLPFQAICVALFVIDAEHRLLPDRLTLSGTALGLLLSPWNPILDPADALVGAATGAALSSTLILGYWLARGRQGMGWGDVKMLAMIGAFLGWELTLFAIVLSSLVGLGWWAILQAGGRGRGLEEILPFGSFLALGATGCLWFGPPAVEWYRGLLAGTVAAARIVLP
ncbi:MAG: prepilin peptidase [Acidobacteria bacterium]|nr:prepilin peptidase [Acidobacteriota bacterium]